MLKSNLREALKKIEKSTKNEEVETKKTSKKNRPDGKVIVAGFYTEEERRKIKILASENGVTVQELMNEAFNILFSKYGKDKLI